jgi:hypothetical protein
MRQWTESEIEVLVLGFAAAACISPFHALAVEQHTVPAEERSNHSD